MCFFVKTQNPRPTFHLDMSSDERTIMNTHVAYWSDKTEKRIAIVFGPVMDPEGVYVIGVCRTQDVAEMNELIRNDPANGLLKYELFSMPRTIVGKLIE
jgi:uncharacterized protein